MSTVQTLSSRHLAIARAVGESVALPPSGHRTSDAALLDGNQIASRQLTSTWEMSVDNSSGEYKSLNLNTANSPDNICPRNSGDSGPISYAASPKPSLLPLCDPIRLIAYSRVANDQRLNRDSLFMSDESLLTNRTSIVSRQAVPPTPLLVIQLGSYDLPLALRDSGW